MADDEIREAHESYGMVQILRTSGERNLVGCDWPTGHYMTLTVVEAERFTRGVEQRFFGHKEILKIAFSEVQFAQLITGVGTMGVPCTIQRRWVGDGKYVGMAEPPTSAKEDAANLASQAIAEDAATALKATKDARDLCRTILAGGAPKKGDLRDLEKLLETALREATSNLPYVVERASEEASKFRDRATAEVEAYFDLGMRHLGERALAAAVAKGVLNGAQAQEVLAVAFQPEAPQDDDAAGA
ncbi:hypothetical protein HOU03_gp421 [Caulobacter phage CcrSC]|uniref:Uncharacterized protein n=1 Tax=Caulobacter phage CcrSC TaxID=2283272 RepID=A0A385EG53_9CAUD|nr:hypothetical protein HOU03_gp421 [Caulobacter phage CcrSC]AXQ69847.1 hypothetical protein CcrSC_gp265c [Caulobacter phage CcrSC]